MREKFPEATAATRHQVDGNLAVGEKVDRGQPSDGAQNSTCSICDRHYLAGEGGAQALEETGMGTFVGPDLSIRFDVDADGAVVGASFDYQGNSVPLKKVDQPTG